MAQATYFEAGRQKLGRLLLFALLPAAGLTLHAQKVGDLDLTREAPAVEKQETLPAECEGVASGVSHSDGFIVPQDQERRKLELRVASLSSLRPALGSTVEAEITLKNIDHADIMIPWSIDPSTVNRPLGAKHYEHESAGFRIRMADESGKEEFLKSLSLPIYSSAAQPQSVLKLSPGQWVAVRIKFRFLINEENPSRSLASGPAELKVEWRQSQYAWERKGCNIASSYSSYSTFYEQITDPVKVVVESQGH